MGSAALCLAWLASLAPLLLERAGWLVLAEADPQSAPRLVLCALPWIALAGAPRARLGPIDLRGWWGACMACLPVLALALALDIANGGSQPRVVRLALWCLAFIALSALAADLARAGRSASRLHASLWIAGVLGLPLLQVAFSFGARSGDASAPTWLQLAAQCSPLQWALATLERSPPPHAALLLLIALCAVAALGARRSAQA